MKCSAKPSTAGPNRLPDETGVSRKGTLSPSFISVIVSQRSRSISTRLDIDRPIAWVVALAARRARTVMLLRSLSEAASRPASSLVRILAWKMEPRVKPLVQPAARCSLSGHYSSPSSLTAFVMTQMSSSPVLSLALRKDDSCKRSGSVTEPDNSSVSEAP